MSKSTIAMVVGAVILAIVAFMVIEERNEGPLEKAAEDFGEAADDAADAIKDAND